MENTNNAQSNLANALASAITAISGNVAATAIAMANNGTNSANINSNDDEDGRKDYDEDNDDDDEEEEESETRRDYIVEKQVISAPPILVKVAGGKSNNCYTCDLDTGEVHFKNLLRSKLLFCHVRQDDFVKEVYIILSVCY